MMYANETADDDCAILLRVALWPVATLPLLGAGVVVGRTTGLTAAFGALPQGATGLLVAVGVSSGRARR